jgi:hypothetical protein
MPVTLNANGTISASGTISAGVEEWSSNGGVGGSGPGTWVQLSDGNFNYNGAILLGTGTYIMSMSCWMNATSSQVMAGNAIINNTAGNTAGNTADTSANIIDKWPGGVDNSNSWPRAASTPVAINHNWYGAGPLTAGSNVCTTITVSGNTTFSFYVLATGNGGYYTYNITKIA